MGLSRHDSVQELDNGDNSNPDEDRLIKQLWPEQETYKREEQRRFEILLAHWDLPVTEITPPIR